MPSSVKLKLNLAAAELSLIFRFAYTALDLTVYFIVKFHSIDINMNH